MLLMSYTAETLMPEPKRSFVTNRLGNSPRSASGLPRFLLQQSARRLQIVSSVVGCVMFAAWFLLNLFKGHLHYEFQTPFQWGPPVTLLMASFVVFVLARFSRLSARKVEIVGLSYEVVASWCIPLTTFWSTFRDVPAELITFDLVGFSPVVTWVLFYTVLVPASPSRVLIALFASLASVPTTYVVLVGIGDAPALSASKISETFVVPYGFVIVLAYVAARIIYGLGKEVQRAQEVGSYRLLDLIGCGGLGEVRHGKHNLLARPAAVKLIRRDALGSDPQAAEIRIARFEREAQVTASLQSPHTVQLYDFGVTEDGTVYYVMELLHGVDLESLVRRFGSLEPERTIHVLQQACHSLEEAHQRGLVHRDIKPANIFLCRSALEYDFVKVLDFGLVKPHTTVDDNEPGSLTAVETIVGTPAFIAPEVALDGEVDGRADIYTLGCVAHWLLTGVELFTEETPMAMVVAHVNKVPQPPSVHSRLPIPAELDELIMRCLEKKPSDRPQTAGELAKKLSQIELENPWDNERSATWWARHRPAFDGDS